MIDTGLAVFADSPSGQTFWYDRVWDVHWLWIMLIGVAVVFFVGSLYWRERGQSRQWLRGLLTVNRAAIVCLVLLVSLGWMRFGAETDLPDLVIAIDDSASMSHTDPESARDRTPGSGGPTDPSARNTRSDLVKQFLGGSDDGRLADLQSRYNVKLVRVGERAERVEWPWIGQAGWDRWSSDAPSSRLGANLQSIINQQRGRPTAAIVYFSDGITTEGISLSDAATSARQRNVPLMMIGVGDERPVPDLALSDLRVDEVVFVDDLVFFQVQLRAVGLEDSVAVVRLRRSGESEAVAEQTINLTSDDQIVAVSLTDRPDREGEFEYVVEVAPAAGEIDLSNNELHKRVQVRDEIIRVLLIDDQPSYEFRYLKELLGRGLSRGSTAGRRKLIELTSVLQQAQLEYADIDDQAARIFPVDRNELFEFDVMIMLDARPEGFGGQPGGLSANEVQNIADFVTERGGGLVLICGANYLPAAYRDSPLETLIPFEIEGISTPAPSEDLTKPTVIEPTSLGLSLPPLLVADDAERSAQRFSEMEGPFWFLRPDQLTAGVLELARIRYTSALEAESWPAITLQRVGPGRVLMHTFDESYRWRVFPDETSYQRYWIQAIRYLSRQKLLKSDSGVELSTGRMEYRAGEPVDIYAHYFNPQSVPSGAAVQAMIVAENNETLPVELFRSSSATDTFEGRIEHLETGYYRVTLAGDFSDAANPTDDFTVLAPEGELTDLQLNSADLKLAAQISRGWYDRMENADELWRQLPAGKEVHVAAIPPRRLWEIPWLATLFGVLLIVLITGEWLLRKKVGMI